MNSLTNAIASGFALSHSFTDHAVLGIEKCLGGKFTVTRTGLSINSGETLSEEEAARAVASLTEISERNQILGSATLLALGDLVRIVRSSFGDSLADDLINQATSINGQSKHTIRDAERVSAWCDEVFGPDGRPEGLSATHLQELKNGSRSKTGEVKVSNEKVKEIVQQVIKGRKERDFKMPDGEVVSHFKALSTKETRQLMLEAAQEKTIDIQPTESNPIKKLEDALDAMTDNEDCITVTTCDPDEIETQSYEPEVIETSKSPTFIYVDRHAKDVMFSYESEPDPDYMGEDFIVISMISKEVLDEDGEPIANVQDI